MYLMTPVIRYKAFFMQYYPCDLVNTFRPHLFSDIGHDLFIGLDEDIEVEIVGDAVVTLSNIVSGLIGRTGKDIAKLSGVVTSFQDPIRGFFKNRGLKLAWDTETG